MSKPGSFSLIANGDGAYTITEYIQGDGNFYIQKRTVKHANGAVEYLVTTPDRWSFYKFLPNGQSEYYLNSNGVEEHYDTRIPQPHQSDPCKYLISAIRE